MDGAHSSSTLRRQFDEVDATVVGVRLSREQPPTFHGRDLARHRGGVQSDPRCEVLDTDRPQRVEHAGEEVARPIEVPVDIRAAGEAFEGTLEQCHLGLEDAERVRVSHGPSDIRWVVEICMCRHLLYYTAI